jgi:CheY-like chemotaxis protein
VRSLDEAATHVRAGQIEAVLLNAPMQSAPTDSDLSVLGTLPVLQCHVPDLLNALSPSLASQPQPTPGQAGEPPAPLRRYLIKPVPAEQLYATVTQMLKIAAERGAPDRRQAARVLIVEDDEDTLRMVGEILRTAPPEARPGFTGIVPVQARTGQEALELLGLSGPVAAAQPIHAVLLDLGLGDVSGADVLHQMEEHPLHRSTPVCVVSGQERPAEQLSSPYLMLSRKDGFSVRELAQAAASVLQVALPGVTLSAP